MEKILEEAVLIFEKMREINPLVVNITNLVVMNSSANILLAAGASPVMSHYDKDVNELITKAHALVLNTGTPDPEIIKTMIKAGKTANENQIPVILDPVGVNATEYRLEVTEKLLENINVSLLRGNASEILTLSGIKTQGKGVESTDSIDSAVNVLKKAAKRYKCVCAVSGYHDVISNGESVYKVSGGNILLTKITGMGCALSSLCAAFSAGQDNVFLATVSAHLVMKICSEIANLKSGSPGSFYTYFLDALYDIKPEQIKISGKIQKI